LALPVRSALDAAQRDLGAFCPPHVRRELAAMPVNWRDQLALWHAPWDGDHRTCSFMVNLLTTPGCRFKLGYIRDVLVPDRQYMDGWRSRNDCASPGWAHVRRVLAPVARRLPLPGGGCAAIEVKKSAIHGLGVVLKRDVRKGEVIGRYRGREITGPLRFLNHNCRPNAELMNFKLVAQRPIRAGTEITIDYGGDTCTCRGEKEGIADER
jgi:hypothetical protein